MRGFSWLKEFLRQLSEHVHELGALYYLWGLISAIGGVAYFLYKQLTVPEIEGGSKLIFFVFTIAVVLAVLVFPLLVNTIIKRLGQQEHPKANPTLGIDLREVEYEISPTHVKKSQKITLRALENTSHYKFRLQVTGKTEKTVTLFSRGAILLGPVEELAGDAYHVKFSNPLQQGQVFELSVEIEVNDPERTMRRFVSDDFSNVAAVRIFRGKYVFNPRPQRVFKQLVSSETGQKLSDIEELLPQGGTTPAYVYDLMIKNPDSRSCCTIAWIW